MSDLVGNPEDRFSHNEAYCLSLFSEGALLTLGVWRRLYHLIVSFPDLPCHVLRTPEIHNFLHRRKENLRDFIHNFNNAKYNVEGFPLNPKRRCVCFMQNLSAANVRDNSDNSNSKQQLFLLILF